MARRAGASAPPPPELPDSTAGEALPRAVRLTRPHGFIDDEGTIHHWRAGHVAATADEVALLVGRGAQHEVLE